MFSSVLDVVEEINVQQCLSIKRLRLIPANNMRHTFRIQERPVSTLFMLTCRVGGGYSPVPPSSLFHKLDKRSPH